MAIQGVLINRDKLLKAIKEHGGCVTKVCRAMGMSTKTFYVYRDQDPELAEAIDEARDLAKIAQECEEDEIFELAKERLKQLIAEGEVSLIIYVLKSLGRKKNPLWAQLPMAETANVQEFDMIMGHTRDPLTNGTPLLEHKPKESAS